MGKTKKLYLARRMMAMILAVAMSVTLIPSTALAAPADQTAEAPEESIGIDTTENTEPAADDGEAKVEDGTENVAADGGAENTEIGDGETDGGDAAVENAGGADTDNAAIDNNTSPADQTDSEEEKVEPNTEGDTAPAAAPTYKILTDSVETTAEYTGSEVFRYVLDQVELQTTEDGETWIDDGYTAGVTCAWKQKGADGNFAPMADGTSPVNAGSYQAVFSYKKETAGAEDVTVDFEITKAPVTIILTSSSRTVKPGTVKEQVALPEIDRVVCAGYGLDSQDIALTVNGIRDAVTDAAVENGTALLKNGDYVMDITPAFSANASEEKKNNYELEAFTADIIMADLIATQVVVTVADKWKTEDGDFVVRKDYDGKPMEAPKNAGDAPDYTYEVQIADASAPNGWKKLEGAEVVGKWEEYDGSERDKDGNVLSPVNAGDYYYDVAYAGEDGVYAESEAAWIAVEIAPAKLTVETTEKSPLTVLEGATMQEALSGISYKVTDSAGKDVTKTMQENHIWGTGFDDSNVSQIYEPLFTLQEQKDGKWQDIDDADYPLVGGGKYRVVYKGQKAVFNADGTYSHRTGINQSGNINGVDGNYETVTEPTADDKALAVEVTPGTEAEIDISKLLDKGAKTFAELTAQKEYDGKPLFETRSQYKNNISLKAKDGGASIKTELREFTFTWEKYWRADDLLGAQIDDENQKNDFQFYGPAVDSCWEDISEDTNPSPEDAGVYRLTVTYEDKLDDGKLYYAKEPAVVYFAIDPMKVKIVPEVPDGGFNVLAGRTIQSFFDRQELKGSIQTLDGKPVSDENIKAGWQIVETVQQTPPAEPEVRTYRQYDYEEGYFNGDAAASYELQGGDVLDSWAWEWEPTPNYTCTSSVKGYEEGTEPKRAKRVDTSLNDSVSIIVKPMGTTELVFAVDASKWAAKEKVYDAEPFETKDLVADGLVTVKKKADGAPVDNAELVYYVYDEVEDWTYSLESVVNAGNYDLYVRFDGSEEYSPIGYIEGSDTKVNLWEGIKLGNFKIIPKEITLKANLAESYTAGTYVSDITDKAQETFTVSGVVPGQEWAFSAKYDEDEGYYVPAWSDYDYGLEMAGSPSFAVYEENSKSALGSWERVRSGKSYEVRYDGSEQGLGYYYGVDGNTRSWVFIDFSRNYKVAGEKTAEFEAVRGNSYIDSVDWPLYGGEDSVKAIAISTKNDDKDSMKREVTMLEGIGYSSLTLDDGMEIEGNLVAFEITAPDEYGYMPDTAMYRNVIESAKVGGHVVNKNYDSFTAVFDAAEGDKEFQIRWEDGYVETYKLKFTEATKLGNLKEAVAPKSLSFNAPNKKMAVGESQQLDVKITKVQMGDVICLGYTSDDPQTLTVNENGSVTALKIGSATIKVFPQRYVKGKLEPIPNAKAAAVKIQVTKLTAPKKVTSAVRSTFVDLNYDTPIDGYRREIYVAKKNNSLKTVAQFESILKGMKEDQWKEHFVIEPVYLDEADESLNRRKGYTAQLSGLDVNTDYTVYVRNTCAARTLEDGSVITKAAVDESAAGTVVNVKTRKIELVEIDFYVFAAGGWDYDEYGRHRILWLSKVKNRTIQCTPYAYFPAIGTDPAADKNDWVRIAIPFKGEDKKKYKDIYEEPKFEYALKFANESDDKYATKNKAASIDKNGKIKFTGIPSEDNPLVVRMRDTVTGETRYADFSFRDEADSVVAAKKSVTLSVGQTQNLGELLTYKLGNTKLTCYGSQWLDMDAVRSAIKTQNQEQYFRVSSGGYLTAINRGGSLNLQLTDKNVEKLSGKEKATAAVTIKSTDLTAIKKLKAYDTIHDRFGLQFTYAGYADEFLLEISDAKKPICSKVVSYDDGTNGVTQAFKRDKNGYYLRDKDDRYIPLKDTYEISPTVIKSMVGLVKETQYTVKLTPIYKDVKAKTATTKVKTTKIPAMNTWLTSATTRGGMGIKLSESDFYGTTLSVLSGNSYTLTAKPDNNRGRVNDTLIWKVGNAKVASVKAAAGTYCITLKGLKPGYTTLEVRSKILGNKVIARYGIDVVAVGDAYKNGVIRYYGENEPAYPGTPDTPEQIGDGEPVYLPLSVGDPRKVTVNQREYFSFTAPETGRYRIQAINRRGLDVSLRTTTYPSQSGTNSLDLGWIQAGKGNSVNLTSYAGYKAYADTSYYIEVTLEQAVEEVGVGEKTVEIEDNNYDSQKAYFCFTAPEDGEYSFGITKASQYGTTPYVYLYESEEEAFAQNSSSLASGRGSVSYTMTGGTSIWVRADPLYSYYSPYTLKIEKVSAEPTP